MIAKRHSALIRVVLDLVGGVVKAQSILHRMKDCGEIASLSSVYKHYLTSDRIDLSARLEFVLRFNTLMNADQLLHLVLSLCEDGAQGFKITHSELTLLAFDDMVLMSPRLTLPHPELHCDPLVIRCASEIWEQYEHPVYRKSLLEICKTAAAVESAEFFIQGKSLVDF